MPGTRASFDVFDQTKSRGLALNMQLEKNDRFRSVRRSGRLTARLRLASQAAPERGRHRSETLLG